jgi:hypothetical protein
MNARPWLVVVLLGGLALLAACHQKHAPATPVEEFVGPQPTNGRPPWLLVSDLHFDPAMGGTVQSDPGSDTNEFLLDAVIASMKKVSPDAPVVIISGDFLAHHFPGEQAAPTMKALAKKFDAAFPRAQFVIALGNNDSDCGDYSVEPGGAFLRAVAEAWAPMVNRNQASPDFVNTFARDGSYVAALPAPNLHVAVLDDTFWSKRFHVCSHNEATPLLTADADISSLLKGEPTGARHWFVMHIPLGFDPFHSPPEHGHEPTSFLEPDAGQALLDRMSAPETKTELVISAHIHRFGYRHVRIPVLMAPAVSPIFKNAPSFLALDVDAKGELGDVTEYGLVDGKLTRMGDLASLGVDHFDVQELGTLDAKMSNDSEVRTRFLHLYQAGDPEAAVKDWRAFECSANDYDTSSYLSCANTP